MPQPEETPTEEELAELAALEQEHGFPDEEEEPAAAVDEAEVEAEEEGLDDAEEEESEEESEADELTAEELGEYTPEEHTRALEALRKAGLEPADFEDWSPRTVAARGLRMERDQAEKQTTWSRLQELQNAAPARSQEEPTAATQPPAAGDPSTVTPDALAQRFSDFLDEDAAKEVAAGIAEAVASATKPLQDALQATQVAQLQRVEADTFEVLGRDFPDPDVPDASLLDSAEVRDAIMARVSGMVADGSKKPLPTLMKEAARLELYDKVLDGSRRQGAQKAERSSRRRKGVSSSVGLRSRKSESLTFDQKQDRLLEAAEKKHFS